METGSQKTDDANGNALDHQSKIDEIKPFIPEIYKDLWEMGANPNLKFELLDKQIITRDNPNILDLGCGKGAELIQLAGKFDCNATGVDVIPEFIEEANFRKKINNCPHLTFKVDDCINNLTDYLGYDVLIYAYDKSWFGDIVNTLKILKNVLKEDKGYILFDITYSRSFDPPNELAEYENYSTIKNSIKEAGYKTISYIFWDKPSLLREEEFKCLCIEKRVLGLIDEYPDKKDILLDYSQRMKDKMRYLTSDLDIMTCLLKKN